MNRITRRRLFRLAGGGLALATMNLHRDPASASRLQVAANRSLYREIQHTDAPARGGAVESAAPFTALIARWHGDPTQLPELNVSIRDAAGQWSDWRQLHEDHHAVETTSDAVHFNPIFFPGTAFQVESPVDFEPGDLEIVTLDTSGPEVSSLLGTGEDDAPSVELIDGFIIPRVGWGADEAYRHEDQDPTKPIGWPPRYSEIGRVIVHHTETEFGYDNPTAVVRAIYYYHAVTLGWADIGYNFLIDAYGNVYEGRYGGPGVVGGHALSYNNGSLGIALIGSYSNSAPSQAAQDSLVRLIRTRAGHVDPAVALDWIDWADVPNICGHGDVIETSCPGTDLQAMLPSIRGRLAGSAPVYFPTPILLYDPKILSFSAGPPLVDQGGLVEIRATITTNGREPLLTQGPDPGFVYNEGEDFDTTNHPKVENRFRLAVDVIGNDGVPNPYRWGLGEPLASGEQREIVGYIRMEGMGTRTLVPSIVREFVRYYDEEDLSDAVHVVHPLVSPAEPDPLVGAVYVPETGHNVPQMFRTYWEAHGGLNRFGFPLTEPFNEQSTTDGQIYLTQYFERARFEYHPELEASGDIVKLGLLGAEYVVGRLGELPFQPISTLATTAEVMWFPETRHSTSYRFLETWKQQGGVETFGFPISEKFEEPSLTDGRIHLIQYFERARFEYHPDEPWDKQIKLGHLGREVLIRRGWLPAPGVED